MHQLGTKALRTARALASKDWQNPRGLLLARHMGHAGATITEIAAALGWDVPEATARSRLKKFNIQWGRQQARSHYGEGTTLPHTDRYVDYRPYRVGRVSAQ